ncbi:MAG TPA: phosphoribosylformylglycinamidine synthase subunit PurQ, partial [Roseiflexaceae bacterium]|nr:phosphoribosylformylglycinamidine synthase subunit PurQ [Roseiflexaceae bacterium]
QSLWGAFMRAIARGTPIIAPCNGFQIAVQLGLLPGPTAIGDWPNAPPTPTVALANNANATFADRWCRMTIPANTRCIWTRGVTPSNDNALLPIAHGEGRFIAANNDAIDQLERAGQIAIRYASDDNPNGSMGDIAGTCDASGLVFGLMPHPERFTNWMQHPTWTRLDRATINDEIPIGLQMFRNAVAHASRNGQADLSRSAAIVSIESRAAVSLHS